MAATLCSQLLQKRGWLPLTQTVRHGSKAVTRHRKPIHILRQKLLAVTTYIPPKKVVPRGAYPASAQRVQEENGLMLIRRRELKKVFEDNKMIAVVQDNSSTSEDMLMFRHRLFKHDVHVKFFPNNLTRSFLMDGVYSNMTPLFIGPTVLVVSKEPKVKEMLKALRSSPQMTLLGACIDDTLLSVDGIMSYSKLPSVAVVQGELVSGLTMLTSNTASLLQRHPARLCALLQQHIRQQSPDSDAAAKEEAT